MSGEKLDRVPLWVVDGLVDVADAAGSLAQAIECAGIAVRSPEEDAGAYIEGILAVLLLAAEDAYERVAKLRDKAERWTVR